MTRLQYSQIPDSNYDKLGRALPDGYTFEQIDTAMMETEKFAIFVGSSQVAVVSAEEDGFQFQYSAGRGGDRLENLINTQYFSSGLLWLLVFPSYESKWGFIGVPAETKELAIENIAPIVMKSGAMLVGFRSGEWSMLRNRLSYIHSFMILGSVNDPVVEENDRGLGTIEFTNLE